MPLIKQKRYRANHAGIYVPAPGGAATTTWNPSDKGTDIALSGGNLVIDTTTGSTFSCVRSVASHSSGKYYYEVTMTNQPFAAFSGVGLLNATAGLNTYGWVDTNGGMMVGNGPFKINDSTIGTGDGFGVTAQVVGVAVDLTAQKIWFWLNDTARWNADNATNQNPATGAGGYSLATMAAGPYYAAACVYDAGHTFTANFGATSYANTAPSGFGNW